MQRARAAIRRLYWIDASLQHEAYPNAAHLGRELGVTRGTIHRDLARLRDEFKAPVIYDPSAGGFHYGHPFRPELPDLAFEESLELGRILERSGRLAGTALATSLARYRDHLLAMVPGVERVGARPGMEAPGTPGATVSRARAGATSKRADLPAASEQKETRGSEPHRLGRFVRPSPGKAGDPFVVRLRFDAAAGERLLRGGFLLREDVQFLTDGGLEASVTTRDADALLLEVLRWAPHFEIAAPAWIRRRLPTLLRGLLRHWERESRRRPGESKPGGAKRGAQRGGRQPARTSTPKRGTSRRAR